MSDHALPSCLNIVSDLLWHCDSSEGVFPATELYSEGWLLRLVLDWFFKQTPSDHPLSFSNTCKWFSEALIPSQFLARYRGDRLAETWTHADGIIGHIKIGRDRKTDATMRSDASHLVITEAKIFSKLSRGVTNASYFNQAARYAACIAELLHRANRNSDNLTRLGLYVLAPAETIGYGWFDRYLDKADIRQRVEKRVQAYEGEKDRWFEGWFLPTLERLEITSLSWESILDYIGSVDLAFSVSLNEFYQKCLAYNRSIQNRNQI
jgi:hypothetical protein